MQAPTRYRSGVAALALMALLLSACRVEEPSRVGKEPAPDRADFKILETRAVDSQDRPEAGQRATEAGPAVQKLLNDFYTGAFIDPDQWGDGTHESIKGLFTGEAQGHVGPNLGGLALADLAPRIDRVYPTKQEAAKLTFMAEDDLSLPIGLVNVVFEAEAEAKEGEDSPVKIIHHAIFWLAREGDAYKISAFQAALSADTETRTAAWGGMGQ
ncbi:MAG TPA: hypothetical protein VHJ40_02730 [Actinomycetota bacterium]|nr:hypothetical protein [Actinomycetota bacterium]